ncbi:hypothetical protein KSP40_PGU009345 [Platanthera guangdongensis]|uniref:Uncharacterized protein n=1 Tax=Platanthera guangdongensis TaxID=2320717 RepID=A0ABR2LH84_9ASPA
MVESGRCDQLIRGSCTMVESTNNNSYCIKKTQIQTRETHSRQAPGGKVLKNSQESKPEQHDHSHANDGEEHEDSKDSEKTENTKTYSGAGEGVEATVVGEETTSSSADDQSGKITGKENGEASGESGVQEVSTDVDASKGKGVDSDEHNNSSSEISIDSNIDGHAGDGAITNDANAFHGDAIHEAEAAGVENVDANFEASKGGEVGAQVEGVSEVENSDNNSSGERKTESENSSSDAEGKRIHGEENSSEASSNVDGNSQNNNSQESKKETEKSEEGAAGDAVESQGNEGRKSEEKSNDVSEKEGGSVNDGAAALTEVNEKISSGDSSTEIPTGEAARSETESTNGGNMEESNKSEQSSNMETGEEGSAVQ